MGKDKLDQDKLERRMKDQRMNGIDIKNLVNEGQEVQKTLGTKTRQYGGLERRNFNIPMKVLINNLNDEQFRCDKMR